MKLNRFLMLSAAGLAFAACSNDDASIINPVDDGTSKTMVVSIAGITSGTSTRATEPVDGWTEDGANQGLTNIKDIALLFTDANGVIKYKWAIDAPAVGSSDAQWSALTGTGLRFIALEGVTQVHAVANMGGDELFEESASDANKLAVGENISTLNTAFTRQGLNTNGAPAKGNVIYVGNDIDIEPYNQEPADGVDSDNDVNITGDEDAVAGNFYYAAEVKLVPVVSRIQIKSIKVKTSGSTTFPETQDGSIDANRFTLSWENFKPALKGIYLNNFYNEFANFAGTVNGLLKNETYFSTATDGTDHIAEGKWTFGAENTDYAADAAYVKYENGYSDLLSYGTESAGTTPLTITEGKCIAFNVFVPFNVTTGTSATSEYDAFNPTIHFQFAPVELYDASVATDGYKTDIKLTTAESESTDITSDADKAYIATANVALSYTMPTVDDGAYLFANISKLYSEDSSNQGQASNNELVMQPGKIYNMDVEISPVNMTIDLTRQEAYNVVVKITVVDFTEENIYPGLD